MENLGSTGNESGGGLAMKELLPGGGLRCLKF